MIRTNLRSGLLATSAIAILAACSGGGDVANVGQAGPVTIGGGTGGGNGGGSTADISFVGASGCPSLAPAQTVSQSGRDIEICVIPAGFLTADATLTNDNAYALEGTVFIGENVIDTTNAASATLTIEPGTVVVGLNGEDALVVSPGSQIVADGTEAAPIVFTSFNDIADATVGGSGGALAAASDGLSGGDPDVQGEWGGLVISGLAPINDCQDAAATPGTVDCVKEGEGGSGLFGGDQPADNSGILNYVRVQYAGFLFSTNDELNGIAFQAVGSGTDVDFVQVHNNSDDGVEFFGGTVQANHVVVTGAGDDSIDWTDGWQGGIQFAVVSHNNIAADRAIEGDNRGDDINITPRSTPVISNFTFLAGPNTGGDGVKVRAGSDGIIANGIVVDFDDEGVDFDLETSTETPEFFSIFVAGASDPLDDDAEALVGPGDNIVVSAGDTLNGLLPGASEAAVPFTDPSDAETAVVSYIGAISPSVASFQDSWLANWTLAGSLPGAPDGSCPTGTTTSTTAVPSGRTEANICVLPNTISSDLRLTRGNLYALDGNTFVGEDAGPDAASPISTVSATLTIDAGVTLYGLNGEDALIVSRGSQLEANGTAEAPIVMTAADDVFGNITDPDVDGLWGGLVINGRAPINDCQDAAATPGTVDCVKDGEGGSGLFGGADPNDDSGNLNYVRVQYAGFLFSTADELNGIAFQGVGDGTEVDFIQVHNNADDGVEFFGGTVQAKHVIITGAGDDSIDWTDGWTGGVQYAIVDHQNRAGDRAIEGDNRGDDINITPRSNPTIANFTFVAGPNTGGDGVKLRAGSDGLIVNGIVLGFDDEGLDYDAETSTEAPSFQSIFVEDLTDPTDADADAIITPADNVVVGTRTATAPTGVSTPLLPGANEQAVPAVGAIPGTFFDDTSYVGAVEDASDDWYAGWSFSL